MIGPLLTSLADKADSRYTLVIEAAKRARQLTAGAKSTLGDETDKPVTVALLEIAAGKVSYVRTKDGIK
ncbi:MAG: DNA-directed RNA polymerase subunit omega [Eubacteriales bacterium]|nr:DNA-directed RNA polymerase subunit omega [Eubacteriales bacterium]